MPPDKPKRKKNNRNRRKNKNNRGDPLNITDNQELDSEKLSVSEIKDVDVTLAESNEVNNDKPDLLVISTATKHSSDSESKNDLKHENFEIVKNDFSSLNEDYTVCSIENQSASTYVVEDPETKIIPKISSVNKSKSLDSDDVPKIVEISDESTNRQGDNNSLLVIDSSTVIVSEVESDVEWGKTDEIEKNDNLNVVELATGKFSITTMPLDIAHCDQTKSLLFEEEASLRNYLKTLNLSTQPENEDSLEIKAEIETTINREIKHKLRKKALTDEFFNQRLGPPRMLDVIDEEGSGESSTTSRRQSYLNDKKSDNEDLEDEVFEMEKKLNEKYDTKIIPKICNKSFGRLVPQECVLVGAKLKEPDVTEARGDWTVKTVEKMTGAEVVYLTDSSSSTSSIHDIGEDIDDGIETDVSVRMITPTIEVTDTENFLKKTFLSSTNNITNQIVLPEDRTEKNDPIEHIIKVNVEGDQNKDNKQCIGTELHEIVVLSTDDIKTDLYVKDIDEIKTNSSEINTTNTGNIDVTPQKQGNEYDIELKVIKCELNDAINNLIKEVSSETEINNETFSRQDSSSSVSSSQCTAKYNPNTSSLNDVSNMTNEEIFEKDIKQQNDVGYGSSHVKDVIVHVSEFTTQNNKSFNFNEPLSLKNYCLKKISSLPYGEKILEELASVSQRLQYLHIQEAFIKEGNIQLEESKLSQIPLLESLDNVTIKSIKGSIPPPIKPRRSSLIKKLPEDERGSVLPSKTESTYICLSPSKKKLLENTNTIFSKEESNSHTETRKMQVEHKDYDACKETEKGYTSDSSPIVSFKSQTGSRLLALIQDPKITKNINSTKTQFSSSSDKFEKKYSTTESNFTISDHKYNTFQDFSSYFKPIPPPRPRKLSSTFYESDSTDFSHNTLHSMKSEKKIFHYSTGNLNKEIEEDVSTIQNMHRFYTNVRDQLNDVNYPRRPSLPKDLCDQQMEYIRQKEREVDEEIRRLEDKPRNPHFNQQRRGPRAPLISEKEVVEKKIKDANNYSISHKKYPFINSPRYIDSDKKREKGKLSSLFSSSQEELQREQMYSEYVSQMAAREERKQHKIIKITNTPTEQHTVSKSLSDLEFLGSKINNPIEKEFISKARERWNKLGIKDPETEDENEVNKNIFKEPKVIEHKIKVITGGEEKEIQKLPTHLQEFVRFTAKEKDQGSQDSGESKSEPASPHVVVWCAVIVVVLAVVKYLLRMLRNK